LAILIVGLVNSVLPQQAATVRASSHEITIRLTVERVDLVQNTENWPDTGNADYFASDIFIADRTFPETERIWDQPNITPNWTWVHEVDPATLIAVGGGAHSTSVGFTLWDDDWADNTPISILGRGGRGIEATVQFDDSTCAVTTLANSETSIVAGGDGFAADAWEHGTCRLDLVRQGVSGDRAAVAFSIQLSRDPNDPFIPLYSWWSADRADNAAFTTTDWAGAIGDRRTPDYSLYRIEGLVAHPNTPPTAELLPLYHWFSPSRGDHFVTTDPAWEGYPGDPMRTPDYEPLGRIGYLYNEDGLGRVPLHSWYDHARGDNFITSQRSWIGAPGDTRGPNYGYVRLEGYALIYDEDSPPMAQFDGRFLGTVAGDSGSSATVTVDLVSSGTSVTGNLVLGPGLIINSGCDLGTHSIPSRSFTANAMVSSANPYHLEMTVPLTVNSVTIDIAVSLDLATTGDVITADVRFDLPFFVELLGCSDRTLTITLTREAP
ncbi:MAG TPA: hypothetical protein P5121_30440, partial [Caldilineaceae bacterium]|nr:hypothetical protein [Caldilineaceae bacterium]